MEATDNTSSSAPSSPQQTPRLPETPGSSTTQRTHETATKTINNSPRADNQGNQALTASTVSSAAPLLIQENTHKQKQSRQQCAHWPAQLQTDEQLEEARFWADREKATANATLRFATLHELADGLRRENDDIPEVKQPPRPSPLNYPATRIAGIALIALMTLYGCYRFRSFPDRFINQFIRN